MTEQDEADDPGVEGSVAFRNWIRSHVAANTPYDKFVRAIMTANGSNKDNPAAGYFKILRDPAATGLRRDHLVDDAQGQRAVQTTGQPGAGLGAQYSAQQAANGQPAAPAAGAQPVPAGTSAPTSSL